MMPIIYGQVYGHKCLAVDAGTIDRLAVSQNDTELEFYFSDSAGFPTSGTVQIDAEQMTYSAISSQRKATVTARGVNGTTKVSHDRGAKIAEIQTEYTYLIANHEIKGHTGTMWDNGTTQKFLYVPTLTLSPGDTVSISGSPYPAANVVVTVDSETTGSGGENVYIVEGGFTTLLGPPATVSAISSEDVTVYIDDSVRQTGDDFYIYNSGGRSFVKFTTLPTLSRSVDVEVDTTDDIDVDSTFTVTENIENTTSTSATETVTHNTTTSLTATGDQDTPITLTFPTPNGTIKSWDMSMDWDVTAITIGGGGHVRIYCLGVLLYSRTDTGVILDEVQGLSSDAKTNSATLSVTAFNASVTFRVYSARRTVSSSATTTSVQTGSIITSGEVYKTTGTDTDPSLPVRVSPTTFTADLVGNSTAETVIGSRVLIDCIGYEQENPADVITHLLKTYGTNITDDHIGQSLYLNEVIGADLKIGFALTEQADLMALCRQIAWQTRSRFYWERSRAHLKLARTGETKDRSITQASTILRSTRMQRTPYSDLVNTIRVRYKKTWHKTKTNKTHYGAAENAINPDSINSYGVKTMDQWFDFDLISDQYTAQSVADFYQEYLGPIAKIITFDVPIGKGIDLERGDVIGLTYSLDGGCIERSCEVLEQHIILGSGKSKTPDIVRLVCHNLDNGTNVECENNLIEYSTATTLTTNPDNAKDYVYTSGTVTVSLSLIHI
jgi:hypothetical protein